MIQRNGERILNSLERRFGKLAFPQILRWIAGFQLLTWLLALLSPDFLHWIDYDRDRILSGEVWRIFSWPLYPRTENPFFILIFALFMFFINDSLESEWDSFRLNLYVASTVLLLSLVGLFPFAAGAGEVLHIVFFSSVLLAFASLFPNQIIHLMMIIPIKAKWLGWINAAFLAAVVAQANSVVFGAIVVLAGLLPYIAVFVPKFVSDVQQSSNAAVRRHQFQANSMPETDAFHTCDSCGATDQSHPGREFRVTAEGKEFCSACLEVKRSSQEA